MNNVNIRSSISSDIEAMVSLSRAKRLAYEKAQPQFWCYAGENGDNSQRQWFKKLLNHKNYLMFSAEDKHQGILGFLIGKLISPPEVYNPGGLTLMIDDFCVKTEELWSFVGSKLIEHIKQESKSKGATQILIVCGAHDDQKRQFLIQKNLFIASEWFVGRT